MKSFHYMVVDGFFKQYLKKLSLNKNIVKHENYIMR